MKYTSKFLIQWASALLLTFGTAIAAAQTVHISHCLRQCPTGEAGTNELVVRHLFAASINQQTGLADWLAYRVLEGSVGVASLLPRLWARDDLLQSDLPNQQVTDSGPRITQADLQDQADLSYRISEFTINPEDRGRLAPMSSFAGTPYWDELNRLSNMSPIPSDLRTGSWSRLDQAVNEFAARSGEVYVISGPLYQIQQPLNAAAQDDSNRPAAYFKVIATANAHAAFIFRQDMAPHARYCNQRSSLQQVEELSGLQLFPGLPTAGSSELHNEIGCADQ